VEIPSGGYAMNIWARIHFGGVMSFDQKATPLATRPPITIYNSTSSITSDVYCIAEKLLKVTIETNNQSPFDIKGTH
jgi:MinD-like ATPase involved in chromosome partitioning or flagellar assembly